jgi:uncharacterized membrane protein
MIEQTPAFTPGDAVSIVILPHRSLSRAGLWLFMAAQSVATAGFALLAAWGGNVFAPAFALVELVLVGYCLSRVWRSSAAGQIVVISPTRLEIASMDGSGSTARFHPYWARVCLQPGAWRSAPSRLLVRSHGREAEIGVFLNDEERSELAQRLGKLLAQMADGGAAEGERG